MALAGARTSDDRRRRRLVVQPENGESPADEGRLRRTVRGRRGMPLSVPWVPQKIWKIVALSSVLVLCLLVAAIVPTWMPPLRAELKPLADHLLAGSPSRLRSAVELLIWTACGAWCWLIAWYRSQSSIDYQGRYRIWAWCGSAAPLIGFFAATGLFEPVSVLARQLGQVEWLGPYGNPLARGWYVPFALFGAYLCWQADRDLRRCLASLIVTRCGAIGVIASWSINLVRGDVATPAEWRIALEASYLAGLGLIFTGLWLQAWYTAYQCPDPPAFDSAAESRLRQIFQTLRQWLPFRKSHLAAEETEEKPKRTRKRTTRASGTSSTAGRRKSTKTTRKTTTRARKKPVSAEEVEETASEETWTEETADDSAYSSDDSSAANNEIPDEAWDNPDASWEELEKMTSPKAEKTPAPTSSVAAEESSSSDHWEGSSGQQFRRDDGQDPFKGLSKKQRRELKKQMKMQDDE